MIENVQDRANEIGKYLSGNATDMEIDALMRWKSENADHKAFFEEMESVWQITTPAEEILNIDLAEQWENIASGINTGLKPAVKPRIMYRYAAAAAVIVLLLFVGISQNRNNSNHNNQPVLVSAMQPNTNELVILPDSSRVWLRSGSEISYAPDFSPRHVTLKGEGFFEVTSDPRHPFTVMTEQAYVRVLGTRFNLKEMNSGDVELFVEEGKVEFGNEQQSSTRSILTRDQVAVLMINTLEVEEVELLDVNRLSWKTGKLVFDNAPLKDVLSDLERHFDAKFEVADQAMLDCDLKADFEDTNLEDIKETIEFTMGWDIEEVDGVLMINGNPCINKKK